MDVKKSASAPVKNAAKTTADAQTSAKINNVHRQNVDRDLTHIKKQPAQAVIRSIQASKKSQESAANQESPKSEDWGEVFSMGSAATDFEIASANLNESTAKLNDLHRHANTKRRKSANQEDQSYAFDLFE